MVRQTVPVFDERPLFIAQDPLFDTEPAMVGLTCAHCGLVHETPRAWAAAREDEHIGCPHCSHIGRIPRIDP